jgi:hypothetical protein
VSVSWPLVAATAGVYCVFFAGEYLVRRALRKIGRQAGILVDHTHHPFRWFGVAIILQATIGRAFSDGWQHLVALVVIGTGAWLLAGVLTGVERAALSRLRITEPDNLRARRAQTQLTLVRRFVIAMIAVLALGAMLMTFPAARPGLSAPSPRWPRSRCWATCSLDCRSRSAGPFALTTW